MEFSTSENSNVNAAANDHKINAELKTPIGTHNLQELDKPRNFEPADAFTISDKIDSIEPSSKELSKSTSTSNTKDAKKEIGVENQSTSADIDLTSSFETEPSITSPNKKKSVIFSGRAPNDPREVRKRQSEANDSEKDQ